MAWKQHGGRFYEHRSTRRDGQVVSEDSGSGRAPEFGARRRSLAVEWRVVTVAAWQAERDALDAVSRGTDEFCRLIGTLMRLALEAAGYHQHDRGEWRRERMTRKSMKSQAHRASSRALPTTHGEIVAVLNRASAGDETVMPLVEEFFRRNPEGMISACAGDVAAEAERAALKRMAGKNLLKRAALAEKLAAFRAELSKDTRSPVERLLVERVVLCWLDFHDWEIRHNLAQNNPDGISFQLADYFQRMLDRSHRRYLHALKSLAQVQKIGPAIQINLAENQVNVAGTSKAMNLPGRLE